MLLAMCTIVGGREGNDLRNRSPAEVEEGLMLTHVVHCLSVSTSMLVTFGVCHHASLGALVNSIESMYLYVVAGCLFGRYDVAVTCDWKPNCEIQTKLCTYFRKLQCM